MDNTERYHIYKKAFTNTSAPFAFIDRDILDKNTEAISQRAQNKKIRIASKSIRCLDIIRYISTKSPNISGVMSYGVHDTLLLSQNGIKDILIGYPITSIDAIAKILTAQTKECQITLMVDNVEHVSIVNKVAQSLDIHASLCLDIDMTSNFLGVYFGVYRSSIKSVQKALDVWREIKKSTHLRLRGVMGYEAQLAGLSDRDPINGLKNPIIRLLKKRSVSDVARKRGEVIKALMDDGAMLNLVNAGGTGSIETSRQENYITEITVGSGYFGPTLFDHYDQFAHEPAAGFALEVTRHPKDNIYTCYGGGYIASGTTGSNKQPSPYLPRNIQMIMDEGFGEVQTPFYTTEQFSIGDLVFFRHAKSGELFEHFDKAYLIANGQIIDEIKTYRGDQYLTTK